MRQKIITVLVLALVGLIDSSYLTYEHYAQVLPPCSASVFVDCGKVLQSRYAVVYGIPLALVGVGYYSTIIVLSLLALFRKNHLFLIGLLLLTTAGFLSSLYFVYLQLFVLRAICLYCMLSAMVSTALFVFCQYSFLSVIKHRHHT